MDAHLIGFVPDGPEMLDRLDVARQRIQQLTKQLAAVTAERDRLLTAAATRIHAMRSAADLDAAYARISAEGPDAAWEPGN